MKGAALSRQVSVHCLLLGFAIASCTAGPRWKGEFSTDQVWSLAREIARNTPPEDPSKEPHFEWLYLIRPKPDPNPELTAAVLAELRPRYEIFTERDSIPSDRVREDEGKVWYTRGSSFGFKVTVMSGGRVQVEFSSLWSPIGGRIQTKTYAWTGEDWQVVEVGPMTHF